MAQDPKSIAGNFLKGLQQGYAQTQKNMVVARRGRKGYMLMPGGNIDESIACPDWETLVEELRLLLHPEHAKGN